MTSTRLELVPKEETVTPSASAWQLEPIELSTHQVNLSEVNPVISVKNNAKIVETGEKNRAWSTPLMERCLMKTQCKKLRRSSSKKINR